MIESSRVITVDDDPVETAAGMSQAAHPRWYDPRLDILRAVAFLCVFTSHNLDVSTFTPAWIRARLEPLVGFGLVLFFVLSAFLLTRLLELEVRDTGALRIRGYFRRRVLRIWPLYFATVLGATVIAIALDRSAHLASIVHLRPENVMPLRELPSFMAFVANWYLSLTHSKSNLLPHLWSLSVEEQFYVVLPFFFLASRRHPAVLVAMALAGTAVTVALGVSHADSRLMADATTTYVISFAAGMLLARHESDVRRVLGGLGARSAAAMGFCVLAIALGVLTPTRSTTAGWAAIEVTATTALALTAVGLSVTTPLVVTSWFARALSWLGKRCFGLYVFHWPVLQLLTNFGSLARRERITAPGVAASFTITVVLAGLSYRYIELPFLRWRRQLQVA